MQRTRHSILEFLKQRGRASLDDLAQETGLATMTVRGHLAVLEKDGLISYAEERGRVGRPRFVYSLTDRGHDLFPKSYHLLCNRILDALKGHAECTAALATHIAEQWADEHRARVEGLELAAQVEALAEIRTEEGAMAVLEKTAEGYILCQKHCPASCVAARHPDVICAAEIGFMRRLLNVPVERVTWIQSGDTTCTYRIRPQKSAPPPQASRDTGPICRPAPAD
ncbi:MAG TPA: winged helix-turn-helix transcriptional regulator [Chloroflexota bacterium]|nr:winged helix-turn-helix transcriptional regulator [Chloroflexota bacterium]